MSKQYQKPQPTGDEYVLATQNLCSHTIQECMKLPKQWNGYILMPLVNSAREIFDLVAKANGVYINESNQTLEQAIAAYQTRLDILLEAYRGFRVFDINFEQMMDYIDLSSNEGRRIKNATECLMRESKKKDPDKEKMVIELRYCFSYIEYWSAGGVKKVKLRINAKSRDAWLQAEKDAKDLILNRIHVDQKAISRLNKKLQAVHQG